MPGLINRRRYERFATAPMYTPVSVRAPGGFEQAGHVYDVSEGGVRFELDAALPPGTPIELAVSLPGPVASTVEAAGHVVWTAIDPLEPGPVRMAAAFTRFASLADRVRLIERLASGRYSRAA